MTASVVSVVVPVHNGMPHLPETLASILSQTRPADEIVVVENGSTDGTDEWLATHAPSTVRVIRQSTLVDAAANWTTAVAEAHGDLVKLVCADDLLAPIALQVQVDAMERHPRAVLAASQRTIIDDSGRALVARRGLGGLSGEVDGRTAVKACVRRGMNLLGEPASVLFRRAALVEHLPWDGSLGYVIDLDMYSRVLQEGSMVAIREPLACFRVTTGSWSSTLAAAQTSHVSGWVQRARTSKLADLSELDIVVADVGITLQAVLRRLAYAATGWRARTARASGEIRKVS
jgi:glycosyltransferase involved in cell wall biosynthesis